MAGAEYRIEQCDLLVSLHRPARDLSSVFRLGPLMSELRHAVRVASDENDLTQASVQLAVSPVLYAVALRPDNHEQLRTAISIACRWWGGIRFPWLPLADDGSVRDDAQKLCDVLDVAGIIDLTRSDASEPVPPGLASLSLTVVAGDHRPPWAMPVRAVVTPTAEDLVVAAGEVEGADFDPVALLGLGDLGQSERAAWEEAGQAVSVASTGNCVLPQLTGLTAVGVTAMAVDNFVSTSAFMTSAALVWLLPDNFTLADIARDLVGFWNYRALRLRHRGTVTILARPSSLRQKETRRRLAEAVSATALSVPMCVFNGLAVNDDDLREAAEALGFRVIAGNGKWTERHYQLGEPPELTAVIDHPLAGWWLEDRYTGTSRDILAIAGRPRWQVRIESPLQWRYPEALDGLVSARITSPLITGLPTDTVAALYQEHGRWRSGGVRIFTRATPVYHLSIGMPQPAEVLAAALASCGRRFAVSDKGREIDGLLAASDNPGLFRRPAFHAVTIALTPHPSPRVERALERLAERLAEDPEMATAAGELRDVTARARAKPQTLKELASHPAVREQGLSRKDVSAVLADMVTHGLATWGFERHCSLCGLTEMVPLTAAAAVPQCTGCWRDAVYTIRDGEPVLHYALGSLLQRVSRNAGLTPLAAAAALRQQGYYIVPGATIPQGDGDRETDLLGWKDHRLLAGEAKAAAALFRADDLARDIEWAATIGATTYVITCPELLPTPIVEGAVKVAEEHDVELLQLTGQALTSDKPPTHAVFQIAAAEAASRYAAARPAYESASRRDDRPASPPA